MLAWRGRVIAGSGGDLCFLSKRDCNAKASRRVWDGGWRSMDYAVGVGLGVSGDVFPDGVG